jgi:arabinose-5-phosphate isomerase
MEDQVMSLARRNSQHSSPQPTHTNPLNSLVERGRVVLRSERQAIEQLIDRLDDSFAQAVEQVLGCRGSVIVSGMGKAGIVGQKLAASLSSTGTPSSFLHPAEAVHGDLGCIRSDDIVLLLSYSGETEEVLRLLPLVGQVARASLAITAHADSSLAKQVDLALLLGQHPEACHMGLAPSCSTTAMLALGDALALVVSQQRGFTREQFARLHPAGNLGKQLTRVEEVMRPLGECRLAGDWQSVREVLIHVGRPGRRTGAMMLTNSSGELSGIFTDSDLARLLENSHESQLDLPVAEVMTRRVQTVSAGAYLADAMRTLAQRKISELPVVAHDGRPVGLIDITDVMSVMSDDWSRVDEFPNPQIFPIAAHHSKQPMLKPPSDLV